MSQEENPAKNSIKSVLMAFDVLEAIASADHEIGVSELAARLSTTKPTVFRHVQTLTERGYLVRNPETSRYRLGIAAWILGQNAEKSNDLLKSAEQPMNDLRNELGLTVVLSGIGPRGVTVLSTRTGTGWLEIGVRPGTELLLHANAQGKIALAYSHYPFSLSAKKGLEALTPHTITDTEQLSHEIETVRINGFARAYEEETLGISALAVPVFNDGKFAQGTLALIGTRQDINQDSEQQAVSALRRTALRISWSLGYKGEYPGKN